MEETSAAARSGALSLELWSQRRSTAQLTSVQLSDAREEVVKAYQGIADLRAEDPADIGRQAMLTAVDDHDHRAPQRGVGDDTPPRRPAVGAACPRRLLATAPTPWRRDYR